MNGTEYELLEKLEFSCFEEFVIVQAPQYTAATKGEERKENCPISKPTTTPYVRTASQVLLPHFFARSSMYL